MPVTPPPTSTSKPPATPENEHTSRPHTHAPTATPTPTVPLPPTSAVSITAFGPGGGSGEATVTWREVSGATGYRVYRSDAPGGPFVPSASYDVATGVSTTEYSGSHEYVGIRALGDGFRYVEAVDGEIVYLMVVASNEGGDGPASTVVCSAAQASTSICPP